MSNQILHISFRADEEVLDQIEDDFEQIPNDERGFNFQHGTSTYEDEYENIHPMLILEPEEKKEHMKF